MRNIGCALELSKNTEDLHKKDTVDGLGALEASRTALTSSEKCSVMRDNLSRSARFGAPSQNPTKKAMGEPGDPNRQP